MLALEQSAENWTVSAGGEGGGSSVRPLLPSLGYGPVKAAGSPALM